MTLLDCALAGGLCREAEVADFGVSLSLRFLLFLGAGVSSASASASAGSFTPGKFGTGTGVSFLLLADICELGGTGVDGLAFLDFFVTLVI